MRMEGSDRGFAADLFGLCGLRGIECWRRRTCMKIVRAVPKG